MKVLAIEPRDIHFVLDFSLEDLKHINHVAGCLVAKPVMTEKDENALQYLEWLFQQVNKLIEDVPEDKDVKPTLKRVEL